MELNVQSTGGQRVQGLSVPETVFDARFNEDLVHQVVTAYMAAARAGTHAQKTRSMVSGGGAKPFNQKGSGRARAGSIRSPIWRGGGKTFAAVPADYSQKVNKKMYRGALRAILSELVRQDRLIVVDELALDTPRTKELAAILNGLGMSNVLIVVEALSETLYLAARNMRNVQVLEAADVDPVSLIGFEKVLITSGAVTQIGEKLS